MKKRQKNDKSLVIKLYEIANFVEYLSTRSTQWAENNNV